jgi:lipoyl(octanoyl) transferase
MTTTVGLFRPGSVPYEEAWRWQRSAAEALYAGRGPELLALLEHPTVYTLGRRAKASSLLVSPLMLLERGADVIEVDRGGDVTFHGPGQLVAYPILNLRRRALGPSEYVRLLEEVVIRALDRFGVMGERVPGRPGVWAAGAKICAIGVRVQNGISSHGFALNVTTDLSWFDAIIPCGLPDITVTSMERLLIEMPAMAAVEEAVLQSFSEVFDCSLEERAGLPWRYLRVINGR